MAELNLKDYQTDAISRMKNGCILCGGVGSGKSRTSLAYYCLQQGGSLTGENALVMTDPVDLYIITTARKRDTGEWEDEMVPFQLSTDPEKNAYSNTVAVDSWNNIAKYTEAVGAFFIFDEQRVVGKGAWVKAFSKIVKKNRWILLSATPGDNWMDYIPVFVANGFYRNRSDFISQHVIYSPYCKNFPKVDRFVGTKKLEMFREDILVNMEFERKTVPHDIDILCNWDILLYKQIMKERWNVWEERPYVNAGELCYGLRKVVNSDRERINAVLTILEEHPRAIIFYNFDYELEVLRSANYPEGTEIAEWNGHVHEKIPGGQKWVYLVQYAAGAEGWNCITTDTVIFYSQNYSYKVMVQASGRIDRMNTPYTDLYFYHLKSHSGIDLAISKALKEKKQFNERAWIKW